MREFRVQPSSDTWRAVVQYVAERRIAITKELVGRGYDRAGDEARRGGIEELDRLLDQLNPAEGV